MEHVRLQPAVEIAVDGQTEYLLADFTKFADGAVPELLFVEHKAVVYRKLSGLICERGHCVDLMKKARRR